MQFDGTPLAEASANLQAGATASAAPNLFAGTLDAATTANLQADTTATLGPVVRRTTATNSVSPFRLSVDASRLGRLLPDSIDLSRGAREASVSTGPTLQRQRAVFVAGPNAGLPAFATNA